jgi:ankyrin repeat protein
VLRILIAAGQPVDTANASGVTALHIAADRGFAGWVEVLLAVGAPTNTPVEGRGLSALELARGNGHEDCVRLLSAGPPGRG